MACTERPYNDGACSVHHLDGGRNHVCTEFRHSTSRMDSYELSSTMLFIYLPIITVS